MQIRETQTTPTTDTRNFTSTGTPDDDDAKKDGSKRPRTPRRPQPTGLTEDDLEKMQA
jgi:hypothetical protein